MIFHCDECNIYRDFFQRSIFEKWWTGKRWVKALVSVMECEMCGWHTNSRDFDNMVPLYMEMDKYEKNTIYVEDIVEDEGV